MNTDKILFSIRVHPCSSAAMILFPRCCGSHARPRARRGRACPAHSPETTKLARRSEEHTSELQSLRHLVCRLLLEKKKNCRMLEVTNKEIYSCNSHTAIMSAL